MMIHPASAHFALVLPIVASVFGLIYMVTKTEGMSKISSRLFVFAALAVGLAWYTGGQVAGDVYPLLSSDGQHELKEHKELGLYIAILAGLAALLKFAGCQMKKFVIEVLAIVLMLGASAGVLKQGKDGGEVVYNYGGGVEGYSDGQDCLEEQAEMEDEEDEDE